MMHQPCQYIIFDVMEVFRNVSYLIMCVAFMGQVFTQNNHWEYTFSDPGLTGSIINDAVLVEDKLVLGGAISNCHLPTLWISDTTSPNFEPLILSNLVDSLMFVGYGKITNLVYDSTLHQLFALGFVGLADDVGGHYHAIYRLESDLSIDTAIFFDAAVTAQGLAVQDSIFLLSESNTITLYNRRLQIVKQFQLPLEIFESYEFRLMEESILVFKRWRPTSIARFNFEGDTLQHFETREFENATIFSDFLVIKYKDGVVEVFDKNDFSPFSELTITGGTNYDVRKNNLGQLEIIAYDESSPPNIFLYDTNFTIIETRASELVGESDLINLRHQSTLYQIGKYYDVLHNSIVRPGLISWVRKTTVDSPTLPVRHTLDIVNVSILNSVFPDECFTYDDGTEVCYLSGSLPSYYEMTVINNEGEIITDFSYHTSVVSAFNCSRDLSHRYIEGLDFAPGDTMILLDSFFLYGHPNDTLHFYAMAPNHTLHSSPVPYISFDASTSQQTISPNQIKLYPNPVHDFLQIDLSNTFSKIQIFDQHGHLAQESKLISGKVNVSQLPPGLYFLRIHRESRWHHSKFAKI